MQISLEELLESGAHFGHQVARWHPKIEPYLYGRRDGVHIFDLIKTKEALEAALMVLTKTASSGGTILFAGTKRQAKELVAQAAKKVGMPYVVSRWLGGTLTNFEQMRKSCERLAELKKGREAGEFNEYTKKERLLIDREIERLERQFGGIAEMKELPNLLFVVDTKREEGAVSEAERAGVPIVGVVDTNSDPSRIDYPIPMNDDAVRAISYVLDKVVEAVEEGKKGVKEQKEEEKE